ncbi:MAG: GNAT family N-acetyltransferase, partial [Oceanicaulis sp.]
RDFYFQVHDLARYAVIEWCGVPIGRLYADFRDHEIRILDFMLLPEVRGKQIGAIVLRGLCGAAAADAKPVTLSVGPLNRRARVFYERHGFEASGVLNGMIEMIWRPAPPR